jgi:D-hydroxyproline dehydrogenase subunit alpha
VSEQRHDVAVIGAGPAGMAAAVRAAEAGASVLVVDEGRRGGGQIWRHSRDGDDAYRKLPAVAIRWLRRFDALAADGRIHRLFSASVVGGSVLDSGCTLLVQQADSALSVHARAVILAPGARELFLPFPGWTVPGVMGVGGAQAMLKHGLQVSGQRVVVAGTGPLLLAAAAALAKAGAHVVAVAEQASLGNVARFAARLPPSRMIHAAVLRGAVPRARYMLGTWVS